MEEVIITDCMKNGYSDEATAIQILLNDLYMLEILIESSDYTIEFTLKRSYTRAVFASVEFYISLMKRSVLALYHDKACNLTPLEICTLKENIPKINKKGEVVSADKFFPSKNNVRFTFLIYSKKFESKCPDFGEEGWNLFQKAIDIRNNQTHPKSTDDLKLTDESFATLQAAKQWFMHSAKCVFTTENIDHRDYLYK